MSTPSLNWYFDASNPWIVPVDVPRFPERTADLCDLLVPRIVAKAVGRPSTPSVVVAHVTLATQRFGPRSRAKGFLDALHDERKGGVTYASLNAAPVLPDDDARYVTGLAVEIASGPSNRIEYRIGPQLLVNGTQIVAVPVGRSAPNDIWAEPAERARIMAERVAFATDLVAAWALLAFSSTVQPSALLIRHRPTRDEDNTWGTWHGALCGAGWSRSCWPSGLPFGTWSPTALASVADAKLPHSTVYELWA